MTAALVARAVEKSFIGPLGASPILRGADFTAESGALTLLMGPSGSGKSTLVSVMAGLASPDAGTVRALGEDLWAMDDAARDKFRLDHCGFIFQAFHLFGALQALEQVALVLEHQGVSPEEARARAQDTLVEVGLAERASARPSTMSGGERQRVAIARALAKNPQIIFADEPTSALDKENGFRIARLLQSAARAHGCAIVCVTHDHRLETFADAVYVMDDGRTTKR